MTTFFLYIVITLAGHKPQPFHMQMENAEACAAAVTDVVLHPPPTVMEMPAGGSLQVTCAMVVEPTKPI